MRQFNDIGRIKVFLKDTNKKGLLKIVKEVSVLMLTKREIPFYYFKYLYRKNVNNYLDYLSTKEVNAIGNSKILHKPNHRDILENKLFFSLFISKTPIVSPRLITYNLGSQFFINNCVEQITDKKSLTFFFEKVFETYNLKALFFRPLSDYGGKGCFKLIKENFKEKLNEKCKILINGNFVHTEVVKQHEEINAIHSKSVSTLRIVSLITSDNEIKIISAFMRFGVGNSVVDNSSSGGFFVGIDMQEGTLKKTGYYLLQFGGREITEHPYSNFKFEGFKVPFFKEACEEVKKAVQMIPDRFIGWDVAITPNGPTIIEGNSYPHLLSIEMGYGGLLKNHHIKKLVTELKKH